MSRLIDADEVVETLLCTPDVEEIFLDLAQKRRLDYLHNVEESDVVDFARDIVKAVIGVIKTSPTVDAIEVVRCKDCKHRPKVEEKHISGFDIEFPDYVCPCQCCDGFYNWKPPDYWFCADGERKEE